MSDFDSKAEIERLESRLSQKQARIDILRAELDGVYKSRSWRITRSLRLVGRLARRMKGASLPKKASPDATRAWNGEHYEDSDFSSFKTDIKPLALYLPQFHTFPENDEWWGKGFTEWTNVRKARPRYKGHNQPRIPHPDIGYYNLTDIEALKKQVALARRHGIYGFAIYYYWFSGKRLIEKPVDMLLEHREIDFPFMLIWANESWTRAWDGKEKDVLIKQEYAPQDAKNFIADLKKYLVDGRYIRIDGKPVIGVYEPLAVPDLTGTIAAWREVARDIGVGEIFVLACATDKSSESLDEIGLFDGVYEFPPRSKGFCNWFPRRGSAISFDYRDLMEAARADLGGRLSVPFFRGSMLEWDNSARKGRNYNNWEGYSPRRFFIYNKVLVAWSRRNLNEDKRFIFINAWNDWGEGTYLEPDTKYGYAHINTLSRAVFDLPYDENGDDRSVYFTGAEMHEPKLVVKGTRIAVQAHVFYRGLTAEVVGKTNNIPAPFDLYITTTTRENAAAIRAYTDAHSRADKVEVVVVENRGRDVLPFLAQMRDVLQSYDYVCHIHTKKSLHNNMGSAWRRYLYENLLGSGKIVSEILDLFMKDRKLGIVFPENFDLIRDKIKWGNDKELCEGLMKRIDKSFKIDGEPLFPAGDMFWARTGAVEKLFSLNLRSDDFPEEAGQVDGTLMHAIERIWLYLAESQGFGWKEIRNLSDGWPLFDFENDEAEVVNAKKRLVGRGQRL